MPSLVQYVESIASVKAIKYIYKYVYKGHNCTTMQFGTCRDEIKLYLDAHYVSSCEAMWRLYAFHMQEHVPSVMHLQVHLSHEQTVVVNSNQVQNLEEAINFRREKDTTLTGWFIANAETQDEGIHNTLYQDFPSKMVWVKTKEANFWKPRTREFAIGRIYHAHPTSGECFYLHLLLSSVSGATCWEDLYSYQGIRYPSFRETCVAHGLLENDQKWHQCLNEARHMRTGYQLCHLFVTILYECTPLDPRALWDTFCADICDDLRHFLITHTALADPSDAQVLDYSLYLIDQLLSHYGKSLQDWNTMPQLVGDWGEIMGNHLIQEQRQYNLEEQAVLAAECMAMLNPDQQAAFKKITSAITNNTGQLFFLHGPGGTGKTFLYNTLCYYLHS